MRWTKAGLVLLLCFRNCWLIAMTGPISHVGRHPAYFQFRSNPVAFWPSKSWLKRIVAVSSLLFGNSLSHGTCSNDDGCLSNQLHWDTPVSFLPGFLCRCHDRASTWIAPCFSASRQRRSNSDRRVWCNDPDWGYVRRTILERTYWYSLACNNRPGGFCYGIHRPRGGPSIRFGQITIRWTDAGWAVALGLENYW